MNNNIKKYSLCLLFLLTGCSTTNIHYEDALFYLEGNNYGAAIPELTLASQEEPLNKEIHNTLGSAYIATKKWNEAVNEYNATLMIDANDTTAISQKGIIMSTFISKGKEQIQKEDYQKAYSDFKMVLKLDIENKEVMEILKGMLDKFIELGDKSFEEEDYPGASINYGIALEIDPKIAEKLTSKLRTIINTAEEEGDNIKRSNSYAAIDQYNLALIIDPQNNELHFKIAKIYSFFTEFNTSAFTSYKRAIGINPLIGRYHAYLGELYYKRLDFKKADKEYLYSLRLIENDLEEKRYNKAAYKYYYDSIRPLTRWIKEIEDKEGLYFYAGDENNKGADKKKETKLDLTSDNIKLYKRAKAIFDTLPKVFSVLKESKSRESEKVDIANDFNSLADQLEKDNEDLLKERELYDSMVSKFDKIGITSNDQIIKLGSLLKGE